MNVLILGNGPEEERWAAVLACRPDCRIVAADPGIAGLGPVQRPRDLDDALAIAGIDVVIVGGPPESRQEALRRIAAQGLAAICLHPPGPDSEAYYQVSLSHAETGAVIVPDLPLRLAPGLALLRRAMDAQGPGEFRGLRYEAAVDERSGALVRFHFARAVDLVRALLGEIEAVTATGDPPGDQPDQSLVVQLRGPGGRRAEVRLSAGPASPPRLVLSGTEETLTLIHEPADDPRAVRLIHRTRDGAETVTTLAPWDPRGAILEILADARAGKPFHPDLSDGTRAMEVVEAVVRSLRRGRTVDLHYEEISEAGTFKSVMTSFGCLILLSVLLILPVALVGPAIGIGWTIYLVFPIPVVLVLFLVFQLLQFALRGSGSAHQNAGKVGSGVQE